MQLLRLHFADQLPAFNLPGLALTIGNFDGVHLGHQALIQHLKKIANQKKLKSSVMLFEPQPKEFFDHDKSMRIYSLAQKLNEFKKLEIDYVICVKFDKTFSSISAETFVKNFIADLNAQHVLIGDDFRFGYQRNGDYALLKQLAAQYGFHCEQMHTHHENSLRISSTLIREQLKSGNFLQANKFLGRPYQISGHVTYGDQRGRKLGYPTANIALKKIRPLHGIYAVRVHGLGMNPLPGAASIGWRPTIGDNRYILETYILNFEQMIYGKKIAVEFIQKIRDEEKFATLGDLILQMDKDVERVRQIFGM